jgi:tetratricopeptide (TPR) repeat protein
MWQDLLGPLAAEAGSLLIMVGALAAAAVMQWAARHFTRVCQQHGTGLAACGLTGHLVAERLLARCGLDQVTVGRSKWLNLYHPWKRQIQLNAQTFESPTLHALTAAAHEVGHAQQFASRILVCRLRAILWPVCYVLMGLLLGLPLLQLAGGFELPIENLGVYLLVLGLAVLLVQLPIQLPLEYDASRRARQLVLEEKLVNAGEQHSVDAMLKAAWLTHAARLAQGLVFLLVVAVVLFLYPTFVSSPQVQAQEPAPAPARDLVQIIPRAPAAQPPAPSTAPQPLPMDDGLPINPFFTLFSSLLAVVPCLLIWFLLRRLAPGGTRKTPAQLAIERNNAGLALDRKGAWQAALRKFDEALRIDPGLAAAYYNRGQTYLRLGRLDEALADFEANLRLRPQYAYAIAARAQVWALRGDLDRASAEYDRALTLAPENPTLLTMRGFTRFRRSEIDAAFADFDLALRYNPREALAYRGRATVWLHRGDRDKSLADLERALTLGDRDALTYTLRGQMWLAGNDHDRAIADLTQALKLDAKQAAALRDRGLAWFFKNQFDRAITDLNEAIRLDPTDAYSFNNRGAALLKKRAYAEAAVDLREAIRLAPNFPNPHRHLAWLQGTCPQAELRDGAAAVANATRALELVEWKNTEWLAVLAAAHAEAGSFDEAMKWQQKCVTESAPQNSAHLESALRTYQERKPFRDHV